MTADQAAAILTATVGKPYHCLRYGNQWNVTADPKGEGCETLYAKPEDAVRELVQLAGTVIFPHHWPTMECLRLLPECRPEGFLIQVKMPDGAKQEREFTQPTQEDDMPGYSKEQQVGKEKKDAPAKPAAKAKPKVAAKPAVEKPKSADELRLAEVCKTIAKHAGEITTLRTEKVALKKKLGL